jgi:DNA replication protein DnaC
MSAEAAAAEVETVCTICGGTGWKPTPDRRVTRCDCKLRSRTGRLMEMARIPARYEHCDMQEFAGLNPSLSAAKLVAQRFVEEYDPTGHNNGLLFVGPIGVGKTHLAVAVIKELVLYKGTGCLFYDYRELLKQIQDSYNASVQTTEMQVLRPVFEAEVLVLDELGAMKTSEWVWDTVSLVLNSRYNERRTTIITTNFPDLPPRGLAGPRSSFSQAEQAKAANRDETLGDRIGERMRSRLHEMCRKIEMTGDDFRQRVSSASFR